MRPNRLFPSSVDTDAAGVGRRLAELPLVAIVTLPLRAVLEVGATFFCVFLELAATTVGVGRATRLGFLMKEGRVGRGRPESRGAGLGRRVPRGANSCDKGEEEVFFFSLSSAGGCVASVDLLSDFSFLTGSSTEISSGWDLSSGSSSSKSLGTSAGGRRR